MTVGRPCYCTREQVARAPGVKYTAYLTDAIDRSIESASDNIDGELKRRFYWAVETNVWDWPNFQFTYPWKLYLDEKELAGQATQVLAGTQVITLSTVFYGPWNTSPPYTWIELDRSSNSSFGGNSSTPQRSLTITGPYGYWQKTRLSSNLAAAMTDTTTTTVSVTNSATPGVGDVMYVDTESMIVTDRNTVDTTQTLTGSGCTTATPNDNLLAPSGGTFFRSEVLTVDSERMLVVDIVGSNLVVKRAWDGTVLATHSAGAHLFAGRQLVVTRGDLGSTAATHLNGAQITTNFVPPLIRDLAIAEAVVQVAQEPGAYSDPQGEPGATVGGIGVALADKWDEAMTAYGRQARTRVV